MGAPEMLRPYLGGRAMWIQRLAVDRAGAAGPIKACACCLIAIIPIRTADDRRRVAPAGHATDRVGEPER